jgi:hypothetical protein
MSVQNLERYGWEFAWRLGNVGKDNGAQMRELLEILMRSKRSSQFADYWSKRPESPDQPKTEIETRFVREIPRSMLKKPTGRPPRIVLPPAFRIRRRRSGSQRSRRNRRQRRPTLQCRGKRPLRTMTLARKLPARLRRGVPRNDRGVLHEAPIALQTSTRLGYTPFQALVKVLV